MTKNSPFPAGIILLLITGACLCVTIDQTGLWAQNAPPNAGSKTSSLPPPPHNYNFVHPPEAPCGELDADLGYRVPLSPEQEKRAQAVYQRSLVIVAHIHCVEPWDFEEMIQAGVTAVILKIDDDGVNIFHGKKRSDIPVSEDWLPRGTGTVQRILDIAAQRDSKILIARKLEDIRRAKREKKVAIILSFEGSHPLVGKLENLHHLYKMGLRELQLWWAVPNALKTPEGRMLSPFGEDVVREMNRLGMVIDLSHMSGQAFGRVLAVTKDPVIISHCSVAALFGPPKQRAYEDPSKDAPYSGTDQLNDALIWAMARNGGSMCVHFVTPAYITARHGPKATVVDLVDNIAYIRDLVGADYVSLGADFFPEPEWHWVEGAGRISLMPNVAREMVRRGFSDEEIEKILGGNLMRIFERVWGKS